MKGPGNENTSTMETPVQLKHQYN